MSVVAPAPGVFVATADAPTENRIGPNAVIQLAHALRADGGEARAQAVFARADATAWLAAPPEDMAPEAAVARLYAALYAACAPAEAARIAADAGRRTADYVMANRIPGPVRLVLKALPARLAVPLLLKAIAQNAWTFAGSGAVTTTAGPPARIDIAGNPIVTPDCAWHRAVFARLFTALASPRARITHTHGVDGGRVCRFEIAVGEPAAAGAR